MCIIYFPFSPVFFSVAGKIKPSADLTVFHITLTFNNLEEGGFGKHCGKRRKCWKPAFSPFPTVFSTLSKGEILITTTFDFPSANAVNLVLSKNLLFGRGLMFL